MSELALEEAQYKAKKEQSQLQETVAALERETKMCYQQCSDLAAQLQILNTGKHVCQVILCDFYTN